MKDNGPHAKKEEDQAVNRLCGQALDKALVSAYENLSSADKIKALRFAEDQATHPCSEAPYA